MKAIVLNSAEELYTELRDKNFQAVGTTLSRKAKAISAQYEERHEAKTVSELKQFVAKLPQMQATKQSLALRENFLKHLSIFVNIDLKDFINLYSRYFDCRVGQRDHRFRFVSRGSSD